MIYIYIYIYGHHWPGSSLLQVMACYIEAETKWPPFLIFKGILLKENDRILIEISLKPVPRGPIDNKPGPCITNVFATCRKNFSQWHRSFQRKLRSHWLKFLRHVAMTLVIQDPALVQIMAWRRPGGRLNKKDGLTRYGNSHVKDKTS